MLITDSAEAVQRFTKIDPQVRRQVRRLCRLLGIGPELAADQDLTTRAAIINQLEKALKTEIWRGETGHYLYSLCRMLSLNEALKQEFAALRGRYPISKIAA